MRAIFAALCFCAFALALSAASAQAGGYGIGVRGPSDVWYSSSCCYRRVVRHQRDVFYVRAGAFVPRAAVVYPRRPVYVRVVEPHRRVRLTEFDIYWNDGEFGLTGCYWHEAPIHVAPGAWFWGRKTTCY